MSLPIIPRTKRTFQTPHHDKPIEYMAFNIGLQAILLQVSDDNATANERLDALAQVITSCIDNMTSEEVCKLPIFVIEELFLHIRKISVSESINLKYKCKHKVGEKECGAPLALTIDLDKIKLKTYEDHTNKIKNGDFTFIFDYPNLNNARLIPEKATASDIIRVLLKQICTDEQVWNLDEEDPDECQALIDSLPIEFQADVMEKFFVNQPHIYFEETVKCEKCGHEHKLKFSNLNQVFM